MKKSVLLAFLPMRDLGPVVQSRLKLTQDYSQCQIESYSQAMRIPEICLLHFDFDCFQTVT